MILEELIYKRFVSSERIVKSLASFGGFPAVFSPSPPDENQEGWGGNTQYPAVVYNFDMQANEERHSAGTMAVSLLCQNTADVMPEVIEPLVRDCLRDVVLKPDGGTPYCFAWARTDAFTMEDNVTIGSEVRFDILEYPLQETSDPDPVMAANKYIKELYPECVVMGYDMMDEVTEASAERPVVFCRLVSTEKAEETFSVVWMNGRMSVHVICPDSAVRMKMAADITNRMSVDGEIIMLDYSPMLIRRLQANYKADYLKEGQLNMVVRYGILKGLQKK